MTTSRWFVAVVGDNAGTTPFLIIVPKDAATYEQARGPLRRDGWAHPSLAEWGRGAYTAAPRGVVDVVKGQIVRVSTGPNRCHLFGSAAITPMWCSAARERRALVVLVPHDSMPEPEYVPEAIGVRLAELAAERLVTAALAKVTFDEFTGPYPRGWRRR